MFKNPIVNVFMKILIVIGTLSYINVIFLFIQGRSLSLNQTVILIGCTVAVIYFLFAWVYNKKSSA